MFCSTYQSQEPRKKSFILFFFVIIATVRKIHKWKTVCPFFSYSEKIKSHVYHDQERKKLNRLCAFFLNCTWKSGKGKQKDEKIVKNKGLDVCDLHFSSDRRCNANWRVRFHFFIKKYSIIIFIKPQKEVKHKIFDMYLFSVNLFCSFK